MALPFLEYLDSQAVVSFVFIGIGLYQTRDLQRTWLYAKAIPGWPTVQGVVILSTVKKRWSFSVRTIMRVHEPSIRYRYTVNGVTYESQTIAVATVSSTWGEPAARKVRSLPVGKEVVVFYNPDDPADAVLDAEPNNLAFASWSLGCLICLVVGILGITRVIEFNPLW